MLQSALSHANPKLLLVTSRALAALRPSLIAFLIANATLLSGGMETPISFCNVLFVGNLCAALAVVMWFGFKPIIEDLRSLDTKTWIGLSINGCLAALLSTLIFLGLRDTTVTNAVLLGRFGPVIYALIGAIVLKKKILKWEWVGFSFIIIGILAIVLISNNFQINQGDLLILGSTLCYAATSLIGKLMLSKSHNLRVIVFSRNFISSTVFLIVVSILFGPSHFSEAFSGQLWIAMSIYAVIIIVLAQFMWYFALEKLDSKTIGKWTVLSPIFGVTFAFILNGERPSWVQVIAFTIIMSGVLITNLSKQIKSMPTAEMAVAGESSSMAS
ncbi:DMT family transporter [Spirulina sp. 06S082]|uniref:DMT family transporter n=1 Tax=Spirulina sp. 06S082 TaxID=3110248 RepID=UPI002B1FB366|nr:DMT family transporter [Spirulina sp. 06S082]MEA5470485.1 DMT family transporter [Spirulina sp. 06S082]